jgi:hypothetical protein
VNWKATLALAIVLALALGVYFLSGEGGGPVAPAQLRLLSSIPADRLERIEIARRGEPAYVIERGQDAVGDHWRIAGAAGRPADPALVREMVYGLDRFRRTGEIDPSSPQAAPSITGLDRPVVAVTFFAAGGARETIRFGVRPPNNTGAVFFQKDGDPGVFLAELPTFEAYDKKPSDLRIKVLARFAPHQATGVTLRRKFLVARGKDPKAPEVQVEESVCEKQESGPERGWFLVTPWRERLDDARVARLVTELAGLPVEEFRPAGDPKAEGFDVPEIEARITLAGRPLPLVFRFGATLDGGRRRLAMGPEAEGEVAVVLESKVEGFPSQRKHLRTDAIFPFAKDELARFEVDAGARGRLVIERRETKKEGESVGKVTWEVLEPTGLKLDRDRTEPFVSTVLLQRVADFLGEQEDLKAMRLDPPDLVVKATLRDGRTARFSFGAAAGSDGYLRKDGIKELFAVKGDLVRLLQGLELGLLHEEIFNVPRDKIRAYAFEARRAGETLSYRVELDPTGRRWTFTDPERKGQEADADAVLDAVAVMNYLKAEDRAFAGRDEETSSKYRLAELTAPATLKVWVEGEKDPVTFWISENMAEKATKFLYWARRADSPVVFKINASFVETLKKVPVKKKP